MYAHVLSAQLPHQRFFVLRAVFLVLASVVDLLLLFVNLPSLTYYIFFLFFGLKLSL